MNPIRMLAAALLTSAVGGAAWAAAPVLPPTAKVDNRSQEDWSRMWWEWAGSFSRSDSPVADRTGERCHLKQEGPVWFLAGTYGTHRTVRSCTVPRGRYLFFPLINYVIMPRRGTPACDAQITKVREMTDDVSYLVVELDGQRVPDLERHRLASPCFDMAARSGTGGRVFPSAANGYYVMLAPPSPGKHVLNFGGVLPGIIQAVTYTLTVE